MKKPTVESINQRPVHLLLPTGVKKQRADLAVDAIKDLLKVAMVDLPISVIRGGRADEIMRTGRDNARRDEDGQYQADAHAMIDRMVREVWAERVTKPRYELLVTTIDLYAPDLNFLFGVSIHQLACVLSFKRFREAGVLATEAAKTVLMHELGHTFGLPAEKRTESIEESLGRHCTRPGCIMRQGLSLEESMKITRDRLRLGKPLCDLCVADLVRQFWRQKQ
jgi:predicted Zn-dependent protease